MVYLSRAAFSDWLATTTPANIFSAAAFFLAFNAPEDEQVDRLGELQAVALNEHRLTVEDFRRALDTVGIQLLDHIVVADGDYVSMAQNGTLRRTPL